MGWDRRLELAMTTVELRTAVVTGASSGIGATIATELGRLGWKVAIGARRTDRLDETAARVRDAGGEPFAHRLDMSDAAAIDTFFAASESAIGPIDVVVNNAAVATPGLLVDVPPDAIAREVATNLTGPILLSRLAVASLRRRDARGHLVFITSDATRNPRPRMTTYTATKVGIESLAHTLGMELEGTGIRTTTIRVGPTISEFGFAWPADVVEGLMSYWPRFGLQRHAGILQPEDIARAVVTAVTAPPGVLLDTIEVQPEAPLGDVDPLAIMEQLDRP
jgi:NADP-dependent 3-hydroxy acid dehydrogenase YdfG